MEVLALLTLNCLDSVTKTNLSVHEDKNRVPFVKVSLSAWHCASCPCDWLANDRWSRLRGTGTHSRQGSREQLWKQPSRSDARTRVTAVTCSEMGGGVTGVLS